MARTHGEQWQVGAVWVRKKKSREKKDQRDTRDILVEGRQPFQGSPGLGGNVLWYQYIIISIDHIIHYTRSKNVFKSLKITQKLAICIGSYTYCRYIVKKDHPTTAQRLEFSLLILPMRTRGSYSYTRRGLWWAISWLIVCIYALIICERTRRKIL